MRQGAYPSDSLYYSAWRGKQQRVLRARPGARLNRRVGCQSRTTRRRPRRRRPIATRRSTSVRACLRGNDTVAKLPRLPHETRRLSCDHEDDVEAVQHRADAIDATTSRSSSFLTLNQYRRRSERRPGSAARSGGSGPSRRRASRGTALVATRHWPQRTTGEPRRAS